jgi:hypothetical protein
MLNDSINFDPILHEYSTSAGVRKPSVTWILAQSGLCDFSFVEAEVRERAMVRGKSVHWMLQLEDEGALNYRKVPAALKPFRKAYLKWKLASGFYPDVIERSFISQYGYAGTFDRYGRFPPTEMFPRGSHGLVDFKTGSIHAATRYQLCAYSLAIHTQPVLAKSVRRIALALMADGSYQVREYYRDEWDLDWSIFMEAKKRCQPK